MIGRIVSINDTEWFSKHVDSSTVIAIFIKTDLRHLFFTYIFKSGGSSYRYYFGRWDGFGSALENCVTHGASSIILFII